MNKNLFRAKTFKIAALVFFLTLPLWYKGYVALSRNSSPISVYQDDRDFDQVMEIFKDDAYWLYASPDYSPAFALKTHSPNKDVNYLGAMHINVLRVENKVAGFVTYYMMKDGVTAHILFLGVHREHRRKGYGRQLMTHIMNEIKQLPSAPQRIHILTRVQNTKAQDLYTSLGFQEAYRDNGFVYYFYPVAR